LEVSYFLTFLAGLLTVTTPCIIPILPPMLAGSVGHKLRPVAIVLGMSITFTLMGGLFSVMGIASGISGGFYRVILSFVIIGFGAVMIDEDINKVYTKYSSLFVNSVMGRFRKGPVAPGGESLKGAFALGLTLGIVWIPCVGPILGAVLTYASFTGNVGAGSLLLLTYSVGLSLPMLAIAYGGKYTSSRCGILKDNAYLLRKIAGWVLIFSGIAILLGIDKMIQTALLPYVPDIEGMILGGN